MREFVPLDLEGLPETYDAIALDAQPIVEVVEADKAIDMTIRFPGFFRGAHERDVRGKAMNFDVLEIGAAGHLMASGKPELPSFGRYVQIPAGVDYHVTVESVIPPVVVDGVTVFPAQAELTDSPAAHALEFDAKFYATDEFYPKDLVDVTGPYMMDGYTALLVHVRPLQYNPKRKQIRAHPRITVRIALETPVRPHAPEPGGVDSREAFGNLMVNPQRDIGTRLGIPDIPPTLTRLIGPQFLIVHAPTFANAAKALAAWKEHRGMTTELLEFDKALYANPTVAMAALKTEIRSRRAKPASRLRYVLLFGDADDIPCETRGTNDTDYYYSTKDDYSPSAPFAFPWLSLGRIPVRDAAEAMAVVDQIVTYERTPPVDPAYYQRFVCAAHFETTQGTDTRNYVFTMETIRAFLASQGYDAERVYTCDTNIRPLFYQNGQQVPYDVENSILPAADATQRIVDSVTEGHAIIGHRDHGSEDGWYMPPFTMQHLDQVTGDVPSIFYSLNCLTGAFQATSSQECFAEKNLRLPGTAPTLIAATELSNTWLNNAMMLGLFDGTYGGLLPSFPGTTASYPVRANRIGDLLNYARAYLPIALPGSDIRSHCEMYHVIGDPSIEVWAHEPKPLHVSARLTRAALQVELTPLPADCVVTIWVGDRLMKRLAPTSPRFSLPIPQVPLRPPFATARKVAICAWAPGFRFAETHVTVPLVAPLASAPALVGAI